jgi:sterol desaturase/sphingolipid hydroxylase (fatty acid hydroxylase superfamily)
MQQRWASQLYLSNPSQAFKISLVIIGIFVGILLFWWLIKKRHQPQFKEYLKNNPRPKEVTDAGEIKKILGKAQVQVLPAILVNIGLLIGSIWLFHQFLDNGNLATYIISITIFLAFVFTLSGIDQAIFVLKLLFQPQK